MFIFRLYIYTLLLRLIPLLHIMFILTIYHPSLPLYSQAIHSIYYNHYYIQQQKYNSISSTPFLIFFCDKKR